MEWEDTGSGAVVVSRGQGKQAGIRETGIQQ